MIWVRGPERILALAAAITAAEWLRGRLLSGFPWNTFGYALTEPLVLAQSVSLTGIWTLTFLCVAICASPAVIADDKTDTRHPYRPLVFGLIVLAGLAAYGTARLWLHPTEYVNGIRLRIMQPNLQQDDKFNYSAKADVMSRYLRLSDHATSPGSNGIRDVTHLIWPEAAFPFFLTREPDALAQIAGLIRPSTVLITGAVRAASDANPRDQRAYNSIYVIDPNGSIRGIYDKVHLVPFGEYLPFQRVLERWLDAIDGNRRLSRIADAPGLFSARQKCSLWSVTRAIFPVLRAPGERPADGQCHERWLVRNQFRAVSAFQQAARTPRSPKGCPWYVQPTPAFRRWSTPSDASSIHCPWESKACGRPATGCDRTDTLRIT